MNGCKKCPAYEKCAETYRASGCAALRYTYGLESDLEDEIDINNKDSKSIYRVTFQCRKCGGLVYTVWFDAFTAMTGLRSIRDADCPHCGEEADGNWILVNSEEADG